MLSKVEMVPRIPRATQERGIAGADAACSIEPRSSDSAAPACSLENRQHGLVSQQEK